MSIIVACLAVGLGLALAWLVMVQRRLAALPLEVWKVAKLERAEDEKKGMAALQDAAAAKASTLVAGLRGYHDELAASLRADRAAADLRARVVEHRAVQVGTALDTASTLVRELRVALDRVSAPTSPPSEGDPHERKTVEVPAAEPAQRAAGLDRPKSARPHPPPKRATLLGIRPPPPAAAEDDRPSDDEVTRVGARPASAMLGTAPTLASMAAVVLPEKKEGAK
jgi:hypothetical protein